MAQKLTKQGVRNLDHLPSKSRGRVLDEPPKISRICRHPESDRRIMHNGDTYCSNCATIFDWDGLPY